MTRKEFWEWLETCPAKENADPSGWVIVHDDEGHVRVLFWFDEETDDE